MPNINIEINDEVHKQAKLNSILLNKSLKQYIIEAVEERLQQAEQKTQKKERKTR